MLATVPYRFLIVVQMRTSAALSNLITIYKQTLIMLKSEKCTCYALEETTAQTIFTLLNIFFINNLDNIAFVKFLW